MPKIQELTPNPSFSSELGAALGQGVSQSLQGALEKFHKQKEIAAKESVFIEQGYPKDLAKLAASASVGGETAVLGQLLEMRQRGTLLGQQEGQQQQGQPPGSGEEIEEETVEFTEDERIPRTPKEKVTQREKQDQRAYDRNAPYLKKMSEIARELPKERLALAQMTAAQESGDFNSLQNAIGEITGQEWLKTASAQTVNSASKQFLMSSLAGLTGRPNVFIEKQITKGLISPLYRDAANKLILEGYQGLFDLKEREVEIAGELEEKFTSKGREIPRNFQKLVRDKLKKEARQWEKSYENKLIDLLDLKKDAADRTGVDTIEMIDPSGSKRAVSKEEKDEALKAGYKLAT